MHTRIHVEEPYRDARRQVSKQCLAVLHTSHLAVRRWARREMEGPLQEVMRAHLERKHSASVVEACRELIMMTQSSESSEEGGGESPAVRVDALKRLDATYLLTYLLNDSLTSFRCGWMLSRDSMLRARGLVIAHTRRWCTRSISC